MRIAASPLLLACAALAIAALGAAHAAPSPRPSPSARPSPRPSPSAAASRLESPLTPEQEKAIEELVRIYEPTLKTLSREVYTYHWTGKSAAKLKAGDTRTRAPESRAHLENRLSAQWREMSSNDNQGPGLYVATDPIATRSYGDRWDGWALYEIPLPPGTRLMDEAFWAPIPEELQKRLRSAFGCPVGSNSTEITNELETGCLRLKKELYTRLRVAGLVYSYDASSSPDCPRTRKVAINLFDPGLANASWRVYTADRPKDLKADPDRNGRRRLANLAALFYPDPDQDVRERFQLNEYVTEESLREFRAFVKRHSLGCGDFEEDEDIRSLLKKRAGNFARDLRKMRADLEDLVRNAQSIGVLPESKVEVIEIQAPPETKAAPGPAPDTEERGRLLTALRDVLDPKDSVTQACALQDRLVARVMACASCREKNPPLPLDPAACALLRVAREALGGVESDGNPDDPMGLRMYLEQPTADSLSSALEKVRRSGIASSKRARICELLLDSAATLLPASELDLQKLPDSTTYSAKLTRALYERRGLEAPPPLLLKALGSPGQRDELKDDLAAAFARKELQWLPDVEKCLREKLVKGARYGNGALPCGLHMRRNRDP